MDASALQERLERSPFSAFLGLRLVSAADGAAELALAPRAEFRQEADRLHGGVLAALCDSAAVYALLSVDAFGGRFTSVELKLNFLRPATLLGADLRARAGIVQLGRRIALCEIDVEQDERKLVRCLSTYIALEG